MDGEALQTGGRRLVLTIYLVLVGVAGVFGALVGAAVLPNLSGDVPETGGVGPVEFALTPLNLALYGMVTVGVMFGAALLLVAYVSREFDDADVT